jgi:hypothetical protein
MTKVFKPTHKGNCQVCGIEQPIKNGEVFGHAFTVDNTNFKGRCHGSYYEPIQHRKGLATNAIRNNKHLAKSFGDKTIDDVKAVTLSTLEDKEYPNGLTRLEENWHTVYSESEFDTLNQNSKNSWDSSREDSLSKLHKGGIAYKEHIEKLIKLIDDFHGTELIAI